MMSPRGRNAIGRRRAISAPSRSEEAAINPHANTSATGTPQARRGQVGHRGLAAPFTLGQAGQPIHHEHDAIVGNPAPLSEAYSPNLRERWRPRKSSLSGRMPATHECTTLSQRSPNTMVTYEEDGNTTGGGRAQMSADVFVLLPMSIRGAGWRAIERSTHPGGRTADDPVPVLRPGRRPLRAGAAALRGGR